MGEGREKGERSLQKPQLVGLLPSRSEPVTSQNEALTIRLFCCSFIWTVYEYVCVCVSGERERERERESKTMRDRRREAMRDSQTERDNEKQTER